MSSPKPPEGWYDSQWGALEYLSNDNRPVICNGCGWEGHENDLDEAGIGDIPDLFQRVDPGCQVPVGTCPNSITMCRCGALVYYSDIQIAYRRMPNVLQRIAEEV